MNKKRNQSINTGITLELHQNRRGSAGGTAEFLCQLLLYLCITGTACSALEILLGGFSITYYRIPVFLTLLLMNLLFTCIFQMRRSGLLVFGLFVVVYLFFAILLREDIFYGFLTVYDKIAEVISLLYAVSLPVSNMADGDPKAVTIFAIFIAFFITGIFHLSVHRFNRVWVIYLLNALPIAALLLLSFSPGTAVLTVFILCSTFLWLYSRLQRNNSSTTQTQCRIYGVMLAAVAGVFLVSALAQMFSGISMDTINNVKADITTFYRKNNLYRYQGTVSASEGASGGIAGGDLTNTGSLYYTNATHLIVESDGKPDSTLYIKAYTGVDYEGNSWSPYRFTDVEDQYDQTVFDIISNNVDTSGDFISIFDLTDGQYPLRPHASTDEGSVLFSTGGIPENAAAVYGWRYQPGFYDMISGDRSALYNSLDYNAYMFLDETTAMKYYLAGPENPELYYEFADRYLPDGVPDLTDTDNLEEVIEYIQELLDELGTYTLYPGSTPASDDFIEYFLFENKRGYCMHYASAATMLFRLHGIPARYVEGYIAPPSEFKEQENGNYKAEIKDSRAHAWTEIFLEGLGWIPIETTPAYTGAMSASSAAERLPQDQPERTPAAPQNKPDAASKPGSGSGGTGLGALTGLPVYVSVPLCMLVIFLVTAAVFLIRRSLILHKKKKTLTGPDTRQSILLLYRELRHLYRFLKKQEDDLSAEHSEFETLVMKAAFSQHDMNEDEAEVVKSDYQEFCTAAYDQLNRWKKLQYRFQYCFLHL